MHAFTPLAPFIRSKSKTTFWRLGLFVLIFSFSTIATISQTPPVAETNSEDHNFHLSPEIVKNLRLAAEARKTALFWGIIPLQYEMPAKALDFFKRQLIEEKIRQSQEKNRLLVVLPPSATDVIPTVGTVENGNRSPAETALENDKGSGGFLNSLFLGLLTGGILIFFSCKYVPGFSESINRRLNPWMFESGLSPAMSQIMLADESSVAAFQATFHGKNKGSKETDDGAPLEKNLFSAAAGHVNDIRRLVNEIRGSLEKAAQQNILLKISDELQPLCRLADNPELLPMRQMTCAVDLFVKQLIEKANAINSSTLRTLALGIDLLGELSRAGLKATLLTEPPLRLLVVDDEMFSRYALTHSLKRTFNPPDVAEDGNTALTLANENIYDLIFLDIRMPGMNGFELCNKIHDTEKNRSTPVVFVTALNDFDTRSTSIQCGGRDLIAKPFLTFELVVKALGLASTERLRGRGRLVTSDKIEQKVADAPPASAN